MSTPPRRQQRGPTNTQAALTGLLIGLAAVSFVIVLALLATR